VPCGISDKTVTSLNREVAAVFSTRTVKPLSLAEVSENVARNFGLVFERETLPVNSIGQLRPPLQPNADVPARPPEQLRRLHEEDTHLA